MTKPKQDEKTTTPTPAPAAKDRQRECYQEVAQVLEKHRCRIVPALQQLEPIGTDGTRAMVTATFYILADE